MLVLRILNCCTLCQAVLFMTCLAADVILHQYSCVMDTLEGNQAAPKDADRPNLFRSCWLVLSVCIAAALCFETVGEGYTQCLEALGREWGTCCAVGTVRPAVVLADTEETVFSNSTRHQSSLSASQLLGASKSALNCSDFRFSLLLGASMSDFRYKNICL